MVDIPTRCELQATQPGAGPLASYREDDHSIRLRWYTGATVPRYRLFEEPYELRMSLEEGAMDPSRLDAGAQLLIDHDSSVRSVIGVAMPGTTRVEDGAASTRFQLSREPEDEPVIRKLLSGILRNLSVGAEIREREITERDGAPPLHVATQWTPAEVSVVAVPADPHAEPLSAARVPVRQEAMMADRPDTETTAQAQASEPTTPEPAPAASPSTPPALTPEQLAEAIEQARVEERLRQAHIAQTLERMTARGLAVPAKIVDELRSSATQGDAIDAALLAAALDADVRTQEADGSGAGAVHLVRDEEDTFRQALTESLAWRMAPNGAPPEGPGAQLAYMNTTELLRHWATHARIPGARQMGTSQLADAAFTSRRANLAMSTSDFPYLLGTASNKILLDGYATEPLSYPAVARERLVNDTRSISLLSRSAAPDLVQVVEGAEYEFGSISERQEVAAIGKYGRMVALTLEMLLNDDLAAFGDILSDMGANAAKMKNSVFWSLWRSNPTLSHDSKAVWHADHGNLAAAGAAPSVTTLGAAYAAMRTVTGWDGKRAAQTPKTLVVPVTLEIQSLQLMADITPSETGNVVPRPIRLGVVSSPYLDDDSTTAWYLAAGPTQTGWYYLTLASERAPVTMREESFSSDKIEYKVRAWMGAAAADYVGTYMNPGA